MDANPPSPGYRELGPGESPDEQTTGVTTNGTKGDQNDVVKRVTPTALTSDGGGELGPEHSQNSQTSRVSTELGEGANSDPNNVVKQVTPSSSPTAVAPSYHDELDPEKPNVSEDQPTGSKLDSVEEDSESVEEEVKVKEKQSPLDSIPPNEPVITQLHSKASSTKTVTLHIQPNTK